MVRRFSPMIACAHTAALCLQACSPEPRPTSAVPSPKRELPGPPSAPSASAAPAMGALAEESAVLPYPTWPVTRDFHRISLPSGVKFEALAGLRDRVWLLADDQVYEHDGKRIVRQLKLCADAVKDQYSARYFARQTDRGPVFTGVTAANEPIIADLRSPGKVICRSMSSDITTSLLGALTLLPTMSWTGVPAEARSTLGMTLPPPPEKLPGYPAIFFAPRRDSLWLQILPLDQPNGHPTFHFDGTAWHRVPTPPAPPFGWMWAAPDGVIWAIAGFHVTTIQQGGPHKFDLEKYDGGKWTLVPVPDGFLPHWVTGTASDDVWFVQRTHAFQWDGTRWRVREFFPRKAKDPYAEVVGEPFMDDTGSLWLLANTEDGWKSLRTAPKIPSTAGASRLTLTTRCEQCELICHFGVAWKHSCSCSRPSSARSVARKVQFLLASMAAPAPRKTMLRRCWLIPPRPASSTKMRVALAMLRTEVGAMGLKFLATAHPVELFALSARRHRT